MKPEQDSFRPVVTLERPEPPGPGAESLPTSSQPLEQPPSLMDHLLTIYQARWLVLSTVLVALGLVVAYLLVATPIYRSNVLLQVEENRRSLAGIEEISQALGERAPPGETEIEILRSRDLAGRVVEELALDVVARPHFFPLVGRAFARFHTGSGLGPIPPPFSPIGWARQFAWGGERISLGRLDVSPDLLDARIDLVFLGDDRYRVTDTDEVVSIDGQLGKLAKGQVGSRTVELFVLEIEARPGTRFELMRRDRASVVEELQKALRIEERGRRTGILNVWIDGPDIRRVVQVLDTFAAAYVRQNVERKSIETSKTLEFLESQLPTLKSNLERAQQALNRFQVKKGTVDLTAETHSLLQRSVEVERQIGELEMQRSELRQRFTEDHPAVSALRDKIVQRRAERGALTAHMRTLPETEGDAARHQRDLKIANELYALLLNKAQELRVVKSGTVGNVRILDKAALLRKPVRPAREAALAFGALFGLSLGIAAAFARKALTKGADDPEQIERATGLPVFAMIPRSEHQTRLTKRPRGRMTLLAAEDPGDVAIENLRSLRTSLQFALVEASNNVIAIGGPSPGGGKSFVAMNLAHVLASTGRRVLLVDADLRRGRIHRVFRQRRTPGLSDLMSGTSPIEDTIRRTAYPGLDMIPTGSIPPNPSELLATHRFRQLLGDFSRRYDLVIIDTPPVLAVTDASLVGHLAGVNLLVLKAGEHPMREITLALKRLSRSGIRVQGAVLNGVNADTGRYGRFSRYRSYEYRSLEHG